MGAAPLAIERESHESRSSSRLHSGRDRCCVAGSGTARQSGGGQPAGAGLGGITGVADNGKIVGGGPVAHAGGLGNNAGGNQP